MTTSNSAPSNPVLPSGASIPQIAAKHLDLALIVKLLQRDVPAGAMPYFKALRQCVWEIERLRTGVDEQKRIAKALADFGEMTGASPWT